MQYRTNAGQIQNGADVNRTDVRQVGCSTGQPQDRSDAGQGRFKTGWMEDRKDGGQDGCRTRKKQSRTHCFKFP